MNYFVNNFYSLGMVLRKKDFIRKDFMGNIYFLKI